MPAELTIPGVDILSSKKGIQSRSRDSLRTLTRLRFMRLVRRSVKSRWRIFKVEGINISGRTWSSISKSIICCQTIEGGSEDQSGAEGSTSKAGQEGEGEVGKVGEGEGSG
jgi:hypothetical protein